MIPPAILRAATYGVKQKVPSSLKEFEPLFAGPTLVLDDVLPGCENQKKIFYEIIDAIWPDEPERHVFDTTIGAAIKMAGDLDLVDVIEDETCLPDRVYVVVEAVANDFNDGKAKGKMIACPELLREIVDARRNS